MARIDELFRYLKDHQGSDLHLRAGLPPRIRVHGDLVDVEGRGALSLEVEGPGPARHVRGGRAAEGAFQLFGGDVGIFTWRPFDAYFPR